MTKKENQKIHTTIGLYPNGEYKINGVLPEHLEEHIEYNKICRFGRALFVDGKCIYNGYLSDEVVKAFEMKIKDNSKFIVNKHTGLYE